MIDKREPPPEPQESPQLPPMPGPGRTEKAGAPPPLREPGTGTEPYPQDPVPGGPKED